MNIHKLNITEYFRFLIRSNNLIFGYINPLILAIRLDSCLAKIIKKYMPMAYNKDSIILQSMIRILAEFFGVMDIKEALQYPEFTLII